MRSLIAALVLSALVVVPASAARGPSCSATAGAPTFVDVRAMKLAPDTDYAAWWSIAAVDDGPPFYMAAQSFHSSDERGRWISSLPNQGYTGWWYIYIVRPGDEYRANLALAVCEYHD